VTNSHVLDRVVVLVEPVDVPVDHRGRDGDVDPVALAFAHDLHVRPELGMIRVVGRVEFVLGLVDDRLRLRQGRVADAAGGVVGHRHLLGLLAEHVLEVARPLAELHVDDHIGTVPSRDRLRER